MTSYNPDYRYVWIVAPEEVDEYRDYMRGIGYTRIEEKTRVVLVGREKHGQPWPPPSAPPRWYKVLPVAPAQTRIKVIRPTTVYKVPRVDENQKHSSKNIGDTVMYWGAHQGDWLLVYTDSYEHPTLQLWAWWEDYMVG